jgi:sigma-B regulation protein RsbU (phosphoserine phosphatase)
MSRLAVIRIPLFVFIASIILFEFPGVRDVIVSPYSGIDTQNLIVRYVDPVSANSAIQRNDEITHVDGVRVRNYNHLRALVSHNTDLTPHTYTLQRDGKTVEQTVQYQAQPSSIIYRRFAQLLVGFTFLFVGILVLVRRHDAVATLFSLNCALLAFFVTDRPVVSAPFLQLLGELADDATVFLFPAVFLHFFLVFHDRPLRLDRREVAKRAILLYCLPALLLVVSSALAVADFSGSIAPPAIVQMLTIVTMAYMTVYLVASLVIFIRNYRSSSVGQRLKLRIAILGTVVGILPFLGMTIYGLFYAAAHTAVEFFSVLALGFVSVSFAYGILKHGAIEINFVVRKSLMYAVFTGAIIAGYYTVVNLVGDYITQELQLRPTYFSFLTILVLAVIFVPARDLMQRFTDRLFFRGEYDYNTEVIEFNRHLSGTLNKQAILDCLFEKMETLLKPSYTALYTRTGDDDDWAVDRTTGDPPMLPAVFAKGSLLGRYLVRYRKPLMVEFLDYAWGKRHLDSTSTAFLTGSGAAVCMPIGGKDASTGLIILGPKRSGQLYNQTDSNLLERFVEHLALVLDNADMHEATVEQERLKKEVLLARDIQIGLLPEEPPRHTAVDMVGKMVSSVEVGGDYFDYFMLDRSRIGIAIGDGSGKGVPAAILMASLQAVFKNLALKDKLSPGDLVGELNRYLAQSAKAEQFATFFYGIIDTDSSTFTFCNAGHCPTLLCKENYVDRLGEGGMPLGVDAEFSYEEGRVRLEAGDLLCLYTDGVTEQHDSTGDQFDEPRLISFLQSNKKLPLSGMQESLFAHVVDFGGGSQDDDMTTIIASFHGS